MDPAVVFPSVLFVVHSAVKLVYRTRLAHGLVDRIASRDGACVSSAWPLAGTLNSPSGEREAVPVGLDGFLLS